MRQLIADNGRDLHPRDTKVHCCYSTLAAYEDRDCDWNDSCQSCRSLNPSIVNSCCSPHYQTVGRRLDQVRLHVQASVWQALEGMLR